MGKFHGKCLKNNKFILPHCCPFPSCCAGCPPNDSTEFKLKSEFIVTVCRPLILNFALKHELRDTCCLRSFSKKINFIYCMKSQHKKEKFFLIFYNTRGSYARREWENKWRRRVDLMHFVVEMKKIHTYIQITAMNCSRIICRNKKSLSRLPTICLSLTALLLYVTKAKKHFTI
jgi:hypothetical protein